MKILIDMNLCPQWVQFLVERGIEAIHWSAIGKSNSPDTQILDYAHSEIQIVGEYYYQSVGVVN